jgi:hypothetical protein
LGALRSFLFDGSGALNVYEITEAGRGSAGNGSLAGSGQDLCRRLSAVVRLRRHSVTAALLVALAAFASVGTAQQPLQWRWDGVQRVVAIGDVHGAYLPLVGLLADSGLISHDLRWIGGSTHLVMLGDLVDRGPRSRDVLDLIMLLQREAADAGGRLHVLLGNHEVMNLVGDLRYVTEEDYVSFVPDEDRKERNAVFRQRLSQVASSSSEMRRVREDLLERCRPGYLAHRQCFAADGVYGSWLLDQRILVVINDVAYVHGGLPPSLLGFAPDEINSIAMDQIEDFIEAQHELRKLGVLGLEMSYSKQLAEARDLLLNPRSGTSSAIGPARQMVEATRGLAFRTDGPLWYRGTSLDPVANERGTVERVLEHLGAQKVVVGHTPVHTGRITTRMDGTVIRADTGMLNSHYGGRASAVELVNGEPYSFYAGEGSIPFPTFQWEFTALLFTDEEDVTDFLRMAPVASIGELGTGSTQPQLVALGQNGRRCQAIFKTVNESAPSDPSTVEHASRSRYAHEVAAYRIDQMLGLDMVPPTVVRDIGDTTGSLQLWVDGAIDEDERIGEDLQPGTPKAVKAFEDQLERAAVFDHVINNSDRDLGDLLITQKDWKVHLINHDGAFAPVAKTPSEVKQARRRLDRELSKQLSKLDPEDLRAEVGGLLEEKEIEALLTRLHDLVDGSRE